MLTHGSTTYLNERAIRLNDLDDNHHRDADHGGQGQSPTYSNGPVRILVDLVVRQWLVFDQGENEAALEWKRNKCLNSSSGQLFK